MTRRAAWIWAVAVLVATAAFCAPAGAAPVSGALVVTDMTATNVSFLFTGKRTCADGEQCDYYSEIIQLADTSACPADRPDDPFWILWTGNVQNTGPTTENGTATPRGWSGPTPAGASRLCQYIYANGVYYYADDGLIAPKPAATPGGPGTGGGAGTGAGGAPKPPGTGSSKAGSCKRYTYQQSAQKALDADRTLASGLDPDGDGVACESLPKRKTYVATVGLREATTATRAALRKAHGTALAKGAHFRARCARRSRTRVRCSVSWRHGGRWTGYVDVVGALRHNKRVLVTHVNVRRPA